MSLGTQLIASRKLKPRLGPPDVYPQVTLFNPINVQMSQTTLTSCLLLKPLFEYIKSD